jgi:predicted acylesterase/phospholipase RssA
MRTLTERTSPTIPFHALLAGRRLERVLRRYFEGLDIWNLWLPFFCISSDLSRAEQNVHERGDLWRAVAASCSIPGIFPPRRQGNDQLVDGGIMNNLPVDVMADRFGGAIIASDVCGAADVADGGESPSPPARDGGWRQLLGRLGLRRKGADHGPGNPRGSLEDGADLSGREAVSGSRAARRTVAAHLPMSA